MDQLLLDQRLPRGPAFGEEYDPSLTGGVRSGWNARVALFEKPPQAPPALGVLERLELEVWWMRGEERRSVRLEAFRRATVVGGEGEGGQGQ
jgi:hypothetical protein